VGGKRPLYLFNPGTQKSAHKEIVRMDRSYQKLIRKSITMRQEFSKQDQGEGSKSTSFDPPKVSVTKFDS